MGQNKTQVVNASKDSSGVDVDEVEEECTIEEVGEDCECDHDDVLSAIEEEKFVRRVPDVEEKEYEDNVDVDDGRAA